MASNPQHVSGVYVSSAPPPQYSSSPPPAAAMDDKEAVTNNNYDDEPQVPVRKKKRSCWSHVKEHLLVLMLIAAMALGIGVGAALREKQPPFTERELVYFNFPGELLMRMLKMLIIPLIVSSLISAVASLDSKASGRIGGMAVLYYMITTLMAVIIGILLVVAINPGRYKADPQKAGNSRLVSPVDSLLDLIRQAFPPNLIEATFKSYKTLLTEVKVYPPTMPPDVNATTMATTMGVSNGTLNITTPLPYTTKILASGSMVNNLNIIGLIVFSIGFAVCLSKLREVGRPATNFFFAVNEAVLLLVGAVIWYSPIGIFFLIATKVIQMEDPVGLLERLGMYSITVLSGLAIHGFVVLPIIYAVFTRRNPYKHMYNCAQALVTALGTASSSATLPVTFRCLEQKAMVDKRVTRTVLPIGATINMDGTALYEAVAVIFIAQYRNIALSIAQIIVVSITATVAAIGAAGIPEAGLVTMAIVLTAVGLETEDYVIILAIDWALDRCRTCINVWGDAVGAGVVEALCKKNLKESEEEMKKTYAEAENEGYESDYETQM